LEASKISKNKLLKIFTVISVIGLLSLAIIASPASALISQNVKSWFWTSDTNASTMAVGDVNGDGQNEIVTAGYFNDGFHWDAQLHIWNTSNMAVEGVTAWFWTSDTQVASLAIGDVNGDGKNEIVTAGEFFDGFRWVAQLHVWNGTTLAVIGVTTWYWTSDTQISSVAIGDVNGDGKNEIVTGGAYFDNTRWVSLLHVWNGTSLAALGVTSWFWNSNTYINSVAVANITGGSALDIVTGGAFFDGTRNVALLHVWNSSNMLVERVTAWFQTSNTKISSVTVGNYSSGSALDVITCGTFNDLLRNNAQLIDWNGATLAPNSATSWFITNGTQANSVALANLGGNHIVVAGSYFDNIRLNAQLTIWG
jgi:hypothetical protein